MVHQGFVTKRDMPESKYLKSDKVYQNQTVTSLKMNNSLSNSPERKKYQVVQIYWFDRSRDRILAETDDDLPEELKTGSRLSGLEKLGIHLHASDLVGQGIGLYFCKDEGLFEETDEEDDRGLKVKRNETSHFFVILKNIAEFPLIEGDFSPGLYRYEDTFTYYEIRELIDLSRMFTDYSDWLYPLGDYKIVCRQNEVEIQQESNGTPIRGVRIYPLNYFDVTCPLCGRLVISHRIESKNYPQCLEIETPCPHYVGLAVKIHDNYERDSLEDKGMNYKIEEKILYFETFSGWQKAVEYQTSQNTGKSFYGSSDESIREVFLFLESGR